MHAKNEGIYANDKVIIMTLYFINSVFNRPMIRKGDSHQDSIPRLECGVLGLSALSLQIQAPHKITVKSYLADISLG